MSANTYKISIIIPVYNEQDTIIPILTKIQKQKIDNVELEIIVIDDGSTDNSLKLLKNNSHLYSSLIQQKSNTGKGGAVREGLRIATGNYILFQDADLEYDPSEYEKLLMPIKKFNADLVIGSRLIAPPLTRVHYFWNKKGNEVITTIFNLLNNTTFTDIYSGYLIYRKNLIDPDKLKTAGWEQQAEILSQIVKASTICYEVPISYYGRTNEEGKKIRPKHGIGIILTMLKERFSINK